MMTKFKVTTMVLSPLQAMLSLFYLGLPFVLWKPIKNVGLQVGFARFGYSNVKVTIRLELTKVILSPF